MKKAVRSYGLRVSPHWRISQVPWNQITALLLEIFKQWGLPKAIRTDNGAPFGVPSRDVVPVMSLWLIAWGIQPILNRPRRPEQNAHVESNQGTSQRWAEVKQCQNLQQMQLRLDEACRFQRDQYRVRRLGYASRKNVFPLLYHQDRPLEQAHFDITRAHQHLAQVVYPRKVSSSGTISLYGRPFQVGWAHKHKVVLLKFDPQQIAWLCMDRDQNIINTFVDLRFNADNLFNLTIFQ